MGLLRNIQERLVVRLLREKEYDSAYLRRLFLTRYGTSIGLYSYGCFDRWRIPPGTTIGRYCSFARTSRILDANHPTTSISTHPFLYDPRFGVVDEQRITPTYIVVEDDVWVGHQAVITPAVTRIGRGAIIGAGAVVTRDVRPYAIVAGNPAREIKRRFDDEMIAAIESSQWWKLDREALRQRVLAEPDLYLGEADNLDPDLGRLIRMARPA
jgi:virginiamycin A acetyltransferase